MMDWGSFSSPDQSPGKTHASPSVDWGRYLVTPQSMITPVATAIDWGSWLVTCAKSSGRAQAGNKNHSTRDSQVVPHLGTNRAALSLTSQIGRDAVLSESYGRGWEMGAKRTYEAGIWVSSSVDSFQENSPSL